MRPTGPVSGLVAGVGLLLAATLMASAAQADCPLDRATSLPLDLWNGHPVVQATIEGATVPLVVDTGASATSVTPDVVAMLRLPRDTIRRTNVNTVGGQSITQNALLRSLKVADLSFAGLSIAVVPLGTVTVGSDHPVGGLFGADLIGNFDVEFDFPKHMLTFYRRSGCTPARPPWSGSYQTLPVQILPHRQILLPVGLNDQTVTALFDTGSQGETVTRAAAGRVGITDAQLDSDPSATGASAGDHQYATRRHRFETFRFGDETFRNIVFDVADFHQQSVDMLVGINYMHARRFFISYSTRTLFVQKDQGTEN